jgi:hypothetical protein
MRKVSALIIALVMLSSSTAMSLESDQYMVINRDLPDLTLPINQHVNATIQLEIDLANKEKRGPEACEDIHVKAVGRFRGFIVHKIESWLEEEHGSEIYPNAEVSFPKYYMSSLYGWRYGFISRFFPLGRNLQIGENQIGQDKLAHFFSTGLRYFIKYRKLIKKGIDPVKATEKVIDYGINMENTYLGLWPAGIFSFGDLEANYQGLQFNLSFCRAQNSVLAYEDGQWLLKNPINLAEYINPYMNEVFNPSYFGFWRWSKIKSNLAKRCELLSDAKTQEHLQRWQEVATPSVSVRYIEGLQSQGHKSVPSKKRLQKQNICAR